MLKNRQQQIKSKGFDMTREENFAQMKVGLRTVDNSSINLNIQKKINPNFGNKTYVMQAIYRHDYKTLREISNYYYESNGIYYRLCRYLAYLYRYDWYVTPYVTDASKENENKILKDFSKVLRYFDKSNIKHLCGSVALDIIKEGVYYGIIVDFEDSFSLQKLPADYCRSRYYSGSVPVVELNLQFFDSYFANPQYKIKVLKTFPKEIQQAYVLYKQGKLKGDYPGDLSCWIALDPAISVKLNLGDSECPSLAGVIPSIIDLDQAQELDRQKTMQQLTKILVQKLPLDKNGDLIFDVDEARDIHNNAVAMLKKGVGIEVLTTFADVEKIDTKDSNSSTTTDDLEKVERTVFNNSGISRNLFNADGNLAVTNSILNDEASIRDIPILLESMLNRIAEKFGRKNHYDFRVEMLETTQYNYKDLAKLYKEHTQLGYNKMLPQIALGHSQSSILATMTFENEFLHLADIMKPPITSNNISNKTTSNDGAGRPAKEESEKADKTIANQESLS